MIVDLKTLEDLQSSFNLELKPEEIDLENESAKLTGKVRAEGIISKGLAETEIRGEIRAEAEIDCSRCLKTVETALKIPFKVGLVRMENFSEKGEKELDTDDLDVSVIEDDLIDLKELVREQIILALPAQVFCREDCKGLCRICGADKNLVNCKCEDEEVDPRWSALKDLKLKK